MSRRYRNPARLWIMASYLDLQTAIASDLTRSDLTSQIQSAVQDAIAQYETDRFWFNTTRSLTFNTVPGQSQYTGTDLPQLANVVQIDKLYIKNGLSTYPI